MDRLIHVAATRALVPGGADGLLRDLLAGRPHAEGPFTVVEPPRPEPLTAGTWRRMSRLSHLAAGVATPLLLALPDRERIPVVWGTAIGELAVTGRFLDRLAAEGPATASPLAFQNSVYNAAMGHLSISLGLRGLSETLAAGGATSAAALLRGVILLRLGRARSVLVVVADDLHPTLERSWQRNGIPVAPGECAAAVLLTLEPTGPVLDVFPGVRPLPGGPVFCRRTPFPGEGAGPDVPASRAPEATLGLSPSMGLPVAVALAGGATPGSLVEWDGDVSWTVTLGGAASGV